MLVTISMIIYGIAGFIFFWEIVSAMLAIKKLGLLNLTSLMNIVIVCIDVWIMGIISKINGLLGGIPTLVGPPSAAISLVASIWMFIQRKAMQKAVAQAEAKMEEKYDKPAKGIKGIIRTFTTFRSALKTYRGRDEDDD